MESGKKFEMWDGSDGLVYWQIGEACWNKGVEVSYCPKHWGGDGLLVKADLLTLHMKGDGNKIPSLKEVELRMDFYDYGPVLAGTLARFIEWAGGDKEVIKWLEENKEMINKVCRELHFAYMKALKKIRAEIQEREEKRKWWFELKKKPVEEYYNREVTSMRNMRNSMYLDDAVTSRGSRELAEEIKRGGKLVDKVVLRNSYDTSHIIEIYEYEGKKYGIEERFFSNGWGMDVDEVTVWEILE